MYIVATRRNFGFGHPSALCVFLGFLINLLCMGLCVGLSVNKISQKRNTHINLIFRGAFPLTHKWNNLILKNITASWG